MTNNTNPYKYYMTVRKIADVRFHSRVTHIMIKLLSHNPSKQATVLAAQD
jgi:hypothetical protein